MHDQNEWKELIESVQKPKPISAFRVPPTCISWSGPSEIDRLTLSVMDIVTPALLS